MYSKFDANDTDVIIIGAGLSGLTAAYYILKKEPTLNIIILEGNSNHNLISLNNIYLYVEIIVIQIIRRSYRW